jgi:hypothetical protein
MKRLWILEEIGNQPFPCFKIPIEWNLNINFATEDRDRQFRLLHVVGDENSLPQAEDFLGPKMGFDEWNW